MHHLRDFQPKLHFHLFFGPSRRQLRWFIWQQHVADQLHIRFLSFGHLHQGFVQACWQLHVPHVCLALDFFSSFPSLGRAPRCAEVEQLQPCFASTRPRRALLLAVRLRPPQAELHAFSFFHGLVRSSSHPLDANEIGSLIVEARHCRFVRRGLAANARVFVVDPRRPQAIDTCPFDIDIFLRRYRGMASGSHRAPWGQGFPFERGANRMVFLRGSRDEKDCSLDPR
eukprot:scaffold682_cov363-Pavlova_lutheri.AAC.8